jgi:DNA invertase Pin-like site-specific DNA recombinase
MKLALYARVSTDEQNPDEQIVALRDYCKKNNHEIVEEYVDTKSGLTTDRQHFQRMKWDIDRPELKIEGVAVWKLDRLSRSLADLEDFTEFLDNKDMELISMREKIDTSTAGGRLLFRMLGILSEFEIDTIKERTKLGLQRAHREGKLCHRPPKPIDFNEVKKALEQGYTLEKIARMQKMTYVTLKKKLDKAGITVTKTTREVKNK